MLDLLGSWHFDIIYIIIHLTLKALLIWDQVDGDTDITTTNYMA